MTYLAHQEYLKHGEQGCHPRFHTPFNWWKSIKWMARSEDILTFLIDMYVWFYVNMEFFNSNWMMSDVLRSLQPCPKFKPENLVSLIIEWPDIPVIVYLPFSLNVTWLRSGWATTPVALWRWRQQLWLVWPGAWPRMGIGPLQLGGFNLVDGWDNFSITSWFLIVLSLLCLNKTRAARWWTALLDGIIGVVQTFHDKHARLWIAHTWFQFQALWAAITLANRSGGHLLSIVITDILDCELSGKYVLSPFHDCFPLHQPPSQRWEYQVRPLRDHFCISTPCSGHVGFFSSPSGLISTVAPDGLLKLFLELSGLSLRRTFDHP